jgi:hypothetical protein
MGLGNALYQWLWAYEGQGAGLDRRVRINAPSERFLPIFPVARERVLLSDTEVRKRDQRVKPWLGAEPTPGGPFDPPVLDSFVSELLLPGSGLAASVDDRLVVNVRRGDYYSVPEFQRDFGFDVATFLRYAVDAAVTNGGPPSEVHVVSDGVDWCREHLTFLADVAPLTFAGSPTLRVMWS